MELQRSALVSSGNVAVAWYGRGMIPRAGHVQSITTLAPAPARRDCNVCCIGVGLMRWLIYWFLMATEASAYSSAVNHYRLLSPVLRALRHPLASGFVKWTHMYLWSTAMHQGTLGELHLSAPPRSPFTPSSALLCSGRYWMVLRIQERCVLYRWGLWHIYLFDLLL